MDIFDTHAHYDSRQFDEDREILLGAMTGPGGIAEDTDGTEDVHTGAAWTVRCAVNAGATFEGAEKSLELAHRYPGVYAACGIHPDEVGELEEEETAGSASAAGGESAGAGEKKYARLERMCRDPRCVAVGEIGLDYHWMVQSKELQQKWFIRQMALSEKVHLPINVHCRDAAADTFALIKAHHASSKEGGIIHCYSGSVEMAREYVKMGYHLGIGGVVTFKNGRVLKEVVREIPIEWLVTETDCPYLAPEPFRGRRNDSRHIRYIIEAIAQIKGIGTEEAAGKLFDNALRVYRIRI
ncbi:MAG: TatD family hydrolase [Lachnospiraceae bacterium]|nr:TatD family hydrolase [Lachnospiraceae bacterium]